MHGVHDITPTISEMASTVSVSSQRLHWWSQTNCIYDIPPTLCMSSYALYTTSYPLFMFSHHCSYHITSTAFTTSHPLYMTSHTCYLWHHIHSNYDTSPTMFVTLNSVYKTSHMMNEWKQNECIWHDTQCICVIKPTSLMTSQPMYEWNRTHCMHDNIGTLYDITSTLFFSFFLFVVDFVIHWNETAMGLHVFPIPIPPPTSHLTLSL